MQKNDKFLMGLLSPREKEIFLLKDKGMSERQIANKLGLSRVSIQTYWKRARKKVDDIFKLICYNESKLKTKWNKTIK